MNIAKMAKVLLIGLGIGFATSAYAYTSCAQCNRDFDYCLENSSNPQLCSGQFMSCKARANGFCEIN